MAEFSVGFAVYGGLRQGVPGATEAAIVTNNLKGQLAANPSGVVKINNQTMGGDPAPGVVKHFGAIVSVDGALHGFACQENQTINFSQP
jgi:hypothetical protein